MDELVLHDWGVGTSGLCVKTREKLESTLHTIRRKEGSEENSEIISSLLVVVEIVQN